MPAVVDKGSASCATSVEQLWRVFCAEAQSAASPAKLPILRDTAVETCSAVGGLGRWHDNVLVDVSADLPPQIVDSEHGEVASQAAYIDELERFLLGSVLGVPHGDAAPSPIALRHENRILRAKVLTLQRQLQEAHARCRRAEQINARWRDQHGALRRRERESWAALQQALRRLEKESEAHALIRRSRDGRREREVHLAKRVEELEGMCDGLRAALGTAMRGLHPEALDALA